VASGAYFQLTSLEQEFAEKAVEIVDLSALGNVPSTTSVIYRNALAGYSTGHKSATKRDVNEISNFETAALSSFVLRPEGRVGISSDRWNDFG